MLHILWLYMSSKMCHNECVLMMSLPSCATVAICPTYVRERCLKLDVVLVDKWETLGALFQWPGSESGLEHFSHSRFYGQFNNVKIKVFIIN